MDFTDKVVYAAVGIYLFYILTKILDDIAKKRNVKKQKQIQQPYEPYYKEAPKEPERLSYSKKKVLNKTEKEFYQFTKKECEKRNLILLAKVKPEQFTYITYTKEPVDFIICNNDFDIIAGIELEGNGFSNNKEEIIEKIFHKMHLPIFRIKPNKEEYQEQIVNILNFLAYER